MQQAAGVSGIARHPVQAVFGGSEGQRPTAVQYATAHFDADGIDVCGICSSCSPSKFVSQRRHCRCLCLAAHPVTHGM